MGSAFLPVGISRKRMALVPSARLWADRSTVASQHTEARSARVRGGADTKLLFLWCCSSGGPFLCSTIINTWHSSAKYSLALIHLVMSSEVNICYSVHFTKGIYIQTARILAPQRRSWPLCHQLQLLRCTTLISDFCLSNVSLCEHDVRDT